MRFDIDELLRAGSTKWNKKEVSPIILRNLEDLCRKINNLGYVPPMIASSCLRSIESQQRINPKAMGSSHLYGCAVDIADPKGELAKWLETRVATLMNCGLWLENPEKTKGWIHLQSYAPRSMNRIFNP